MRGGRYKLRAGRQYLLPRYPGFISGASQWRGKICVAPTEGAGQKSARQSTAVSRQLQGIYLGVFLITTAASNGLVGSGMLYFLRSQSSSWPINLDIPRIRHLAMKSCISRRGRVGGRGSRHQRPTWPAPGAHWTAQNYGAHSQLLATLQPSTLCLRPSRATPNNCLPALFPQGARVRMPIRRQPGYHSCGINSEPGAWL